MEYTINCSNSKHAIRTNILFATKNKEVFPDFTFLFFFYHHWEKRLQTSETRISFQPVNDILKMVITQLANMISPFVSSNPPRNSCKKPGFRNMWPCIVIYWVHDIPLVLSKHFQSLDRIQVSSSEGKVGRPQRLRPT